MPAVTDYPANNGIGRRVSIRRDDDDFVVAFQPQDYVIFRSEDASELRRVCRFFQWEVVRDTASDFPEQPSRRALQRDLAYVAGGEGSQQRDLIRSKTG